MTKAEVVQIKASGVVVRLQNGEEAWLPGQELAANYNSAKALFKQSLCTKGELLEVIEYGKEVGGERKLVSRIRAHDDPWNKVKYWKNGEVKEMEISSVTPRRAFGQIAPGIQGYIDIEEMQDKKKCRFPRSWENFKMISVGDIIAGFVYTHGVNEKKRLVKIDVVSYITGLSDISTTLPVISENQGKLVTGLEAKLTNHMELFIPEIPEVRQILVVDDYKQFSLEVSEYLSDCGVETTAAISKEEAIKFLSNQDCPDLDIAIVDIHLTANNNYEGLAIAKLIKEKQPRCHIILTTGDEIGANKMLASAGEFNISAFLFKPFGLEELNLAISTTVRESPRPLKDFISGKGNEDARQSSTKSKTPRMYSALDDLRKKTKADSVILFAIHPTSFKVKIVEECGKINEDIDDYLLKLRYSPVKDVAIDKEKIFEPGASGPFSYPKHRWLQDALKYESCIALPVEVDHEWSYAVFVFHRDPHKFLEKEKYAVQTAAKELAYIIEIKRLQDTWRWETPFILAGKTYGSMAHDLIHAVSREFGIPRIFKILENKKEIEKEEIDKIKQYLNALLTELKRAKGIVETFRRMSRSHMDEEAEVDVLDVITRVSKNLEIEVKALNTKVMVSFENIEIRPKTYLRIVSFEQMVYNLVLNAAQQIHRFRFARSEGLVKIELSEIVSRGERWVRLLVHDNGPGIHAHSYEQIFDVGYTTKEDGCGMGLDICRNIVKDAGGAIRVLKSVLFVGTTFEILLPTKG